MINLQGSDYIISNHSMDETWQLVKSAFEKSSSSDRTWSLLEDRRGSRITATMEYQKKLRMKRVLMLEVNFYPGADATSIQLELRYTISPMIDIREPEQILEATANDIATALGGTIQQGLPKGTSLVTAEPEAKAKSGLMAGIEVVLVLNVIILFIGAFTSTLGQVMPLLLGGQLALILPGALFVTLYKYFSKPLTGTASFAEHTALEKVLVGSLSFAAGVMICAAAVPIILFGLCIGAMAIFSGSSFH